MLYFYCLFCLSDSDPGSTESLLFEIIDKISFSFMSEGFRLLRLFACVLGWETAS